MRKIIVSHPVLFLSGLIFVLLRDHSGLARMALAASLLHESGHVMAYWGFTHRFPVLQFSLSGIGLRLGGIHLCAYQRLWLAAAGPLTNLLVSSMLLVVLGARASYQGYFFASTNLCVGIFNLLPFGSLDGRQILQAMREI